jgi:hypothetical protein
MIQFLETNTTIGARIISPRLIQETHAGAVDSMQERRP